MRIRNANVNDIKNIHDLISKYSKKGLMLYRPHFEIAMHVRDYFVAEDKSKIVGCVALKVWTQDTAEIYALAVNENCQGKGVGSALIKNCIKDAKKLGIKKIITFTYQFKLFEKFGFKKTNKVPKILYTEKTINIDKAFSLSL